METNTLANLFVGVWATNHLFNTDLFTTAAVPGRSAALDVCGLLQCNSGPRRRSASSFLIVKFHIPLPACLDSRWVAAPCRHPNPVPRSRHRIQPQRTTNVGKIAATQMEKRNPNSPPPTESSPRHGQSSLTHYLPLGGSTHCVLSTRRRGWLCPPFVCARFS